MRVATGRLVNTRGALRANSSATVQATSEVDNRGGLMSSRGTLTIEDPNQAKALNVLNTGGSLVADTDLTIDAKTFSQDGQAVNITSGGDLNIKGAVVAANRVTADVGGNLNIESLQDTSVGQSRQSSSGVNLSLCIPPFCYGVSTVGGKRGARQGQRQSCERAVRRRQCLPPRQAHHRLETRRWTACSGSSSIGQRLDSAHC